jgi:hypothetical protein
MSTKDTVILSARVVSFWVLFVAFALGATVGNLYLWAPQLFKGPATGWGGFARSMAAASMTLPPFKWFDFNVEQMILLGIMLDVVGMIGLMIAPKVSGGVILGLAGWRHIVMRTMKSSNEIPNHPLCGFKSAHCPLVDLIRLLTLTAAIIAVTSNQGLPETTLSLLKQMGLNTSKFEGMVRRIKNTVTSGGTHVGGHQQQVGGASRKDL